MPKGPRGEKRPADAIGLAVLVGRIATGEAEDTRDDSPKATIPAPRSEPSEPRRKDRSKGD